MVSGNPPRHSKSNDEPVTIDLEAEDSTHAATPENAPGDDLGKDEAPPAADIPADPEGEALSAEHKAAMDQLDDALSDKARESAASGYAAQPGSAAPETAATERQIPEDATREPPAQPQPRQAAIASLVASGIVGGLIALACVGAIDYAGLLPGSRDKADNGQQIASLNAEIDGLKQTMANLAAQPAPKQDAALADRVAALETSVKNLPAAGSSNGGTGAADSSALDAANQKIADLSSALDAIKANLAQVSQSQASVGADVDKRLDDAEKKLNAPGKDAAVARAIAAAGLKAAIDRGGPFRPELDTYAGVAPDDPAIADLRKFAETGIPSRGDLIRQVPNVATAIVNAAQPASADESWSNRLMSSAKSLVTVRPVGDVPGDSVDAIAARFENKVRNGDLPGAVSEWNTLPDGAKSASAAFKQSLDARIRVEDLVSEALSKAIATAGKQD